MRRYSREVEENIRAERQLREWARSGLLASDVSASLQAEVSVDLRRTNDALRLTLFAFTAVILIAAVWLFGELLGVHDSTSFAFIHAVSALVSFGLADLLVARARLYRFGVEEALAIGAIVLLAVSAGEFASPDFRVTSQILFPLTVAFAAGSIGALAVYLRFGYLLAAILSMAAAAAIAFPLVESRVGERALAASVFLLVFFIAKETRRPHGEDYPGDEYGVIQTIAWFGMYLVLNLRLPGGGEFPFAFYWTTYALTWLIPIIGLTMGIREKQREMIQANVVLAIITLMTNKPYLRMARHSWDPILLGVLLMGVAILFRRWLAKGPDNAQYGFTAKRLLAADLRAVQLAGLASAAIQPGMGSHSSPSSPALKPGGGESGGGGASGSF